jgi:hypothetical protein
MKEEKPITFFGKGILEMSFQRTVRSGMEAVIMT